MFLHPRGETPETAFINLGGPPPQIRKRGAVSGWRAALRPSGFIRSGLRAGMGPPSMSAVSDAFPPSGKWKRANGEWRIMAAERAVSNIRACHSSNASFSIVNMQFAPKGRECAGNGAHICGRLVLRKSDKEGLSAGGGPYNHGRPGFHMPPVCRWAACGRATVWPYRGRKRRR
jgi:hypothetical protein